MTDSSPISPLREDEGHILRSLAILAMSGGLGVLAGYAGQVGAVLLAVAMALALVTFGVWSARIAQAWRRSRRRACVAGVIDADSGAALLVSQAGRILHANPGAQNRFGRGACDLKAAFYWLGAEVEVTITRLHDLAHRRTTARETIQAAGGGVRLLVRHIGDQDFLWRIEDEGAVTRKPDGDLVPLMTLSKTGVVSAMNPAARRLAGRRVTTLDRFFVDLPVRPGAINTVTGPDGPVQVLVALRDLGADRQEMALMPLHDASAMGGGVGFDALPVGFLKLDISGRILRANTLAQELLGRACVGLSLPDLMEGLGRPVADWLRDAAARGGATRTEVLRLSGRETDTFVQVTVSRPRGAAHDTLFAVLNDATELKTLEAQFVQSQKMQAIGQLAGGVAHDFNNLLTAISGHCDLLLLRHDTGDEDYGDLMQIHQNANRAAALVTQLLAFSRKQTLRAEVLDVRDTLADLTHLLNRLVGERVTLSLSHDPVLGAIRADRRQLEQVLMNLVVNARDAMPDGGEIRIVTEALHLNEALERDRAVVPAGDYVSVKVIDQGTGIAADKLQKVFEPFFTTKRTGEGTGLGLSTAYGIIKQTGGFIFVDSAPGAGACFTLIFPICAATPAPNPGTGGAGRKSIPVQGSGVVLLVEDEAPVRAFASRALQLRGFSVIEAASAEEALDVLSDDRLQVDLFVTDVVMPGVDGPTWVQRARATRPDVGVVFVSGYAEGALGGSVPEVANSVFLPKPFSLAQLTETVRDQLAQSPPLLN